MPSIEKILKVSILAQVFGICLLYLTSMISVPVLLVLFIPMASGFILLGVLGWAWFFFRSL